LTGGKLPSRVVLLLEASVKIYSMLIHPSEHSFNKEMFSAANTVFADNGHTVKTIDLYHSQFDPRELTNNIVNLSNSSYDQKWTRAEKLDLLPEFTIGELEKLKECDILYIQSPIWLWSPPAILKSYMESVFIFNTVFTTPHHAFDTTLPFRLFKGKRVILSLTASASEEMMLQNFRDKHELLVHLKNVFELVGFEFIDPFIAWEQNGESDHRETDINNLCNYIQSTVLKD
jgi:NAD(P)H dehydrogenase (quinone)